MGRMDIFSISYYDDVLSYTERGVNYQIRNLSKPSWSQSLNFSTYGQVDHSSTPNAALNGIRVLDLTRILAGPYCTMILGDMGAEIIKIERPGVGDDTRAWGPPFLDSESCYNLCVNRNKKSVTVDLKKPEGRDIVKKLAAISDVLVENYIPGKLSAMGLGYPEISAEFPHLIYCSVTGYGQTGCYANRAGYDLVASAVGGLMHITGPADGEPSKTGVALTDLATGLYAVGGILASLLSRQKTGSGQHIDCNLLSTSVASLVNIGSSYLNAGEEGKRFGTAHASIVPYQAFPTKDGYIIASGANNSQFQILVKRIGHPELATDDRFITNSARVKNRVTLINFLSSVFEKKPTAEWLDILEGSGIPYGPINNLQHVFSDPQVLHNGMIQEIPHPTLGNVRVPGPAVHFSHTPTVEPTAPPLLGQHTEEVLGGLLGYSHTEMVQLRKNKVIE